MKNIVKNIVMAISVVFSLAANAQEVENFTTATNAAFKGHRWGCREVEAKVEDGWVKSLDIVNHGGFELRAVAGFQGDSWNNSDNESGSNAAVRYGVGVDFVWVTTKLPVGIILGGELGKTTSNTYDGEAISPVYYQVNAGVRLMPHNRINVDVLATFGEQKLMTNKVVDTPEIKGNIPAEAMTPQFGAQARLNYVVGYTKTNDTVDGIKRTVKRPINVGLQAEYKFGGNFNKPGMDASVKANAYFVGAYASITF